MIKHVKIILSIIDLGQNEEDIALCEFLERPTAHSVPIIMNISNFSQMSMRMQKPENIII